MIRVDRSGVAVPAVLSEDGRRGPNETAAITASLTAWRAAGKPAATWKYSFAAYRDPEIKKALAELFHGKCAYCESTYGATQPMDVEHWRPKGGIEGPAGLIQPGYYWLAASWENLLPSCIDCNRERIQLDALTNIERKIGKQNQFPIESEADRATAPDELSLEVPLLLDPCADDPEDYFECTDDGIITPRAADGLAYERARASIDVYALNRNGLVFARTQLIRRIRLRIARVAQIARLMGEEVLSERAVLMLDDLLAHDLGELARMRRDDQPYALVTRLLIDRWMRELTGSGRTDSVLAAPVIPGRTT